MPDHEYSRLCISDLGSDHSRDSFSPQYLVKSSLLFYLRIVLIK